jgi:transposase
LLRLSKVRLRKETKAGVDSGYQGLQREHENTSLPKKKTKRNPLTKEQKQANRQQARERILVENVIGWLKRFRLLAERYRCRRKRFGLRLSLISGIYNWELENVNDVSG